MQYINDLSGKVFFISAFKSGWPSYLIGGNYRAHLKIRGATVIDEFDADA
ncbi:MAG: hypothetical protein GQ582_04275, partial [Methyloprofundus sp.]|nr:hypothetical protein [Methyloprofundus sp.]